MDKREIKSIIEALLFVWGEPLKLKDIANVLGLDIKIVKKVMEDMIDEFEFNRRGLRIIQIDDSFQFSTRPDHHHWISKLTREERKQNLSNAALETLSIIAYKQPVTKNEIDNIRGVKSDRVIKTLLEKKLIEEKGRLDQIGRPIIYGTTMEFLRYFGIKTLKDLPRLENFNISNRNLEG